jgi:hypothetical protein
MKKTGTMLVAVLLLCGMSASLFAENAGDTAWNERIASPSYGLNLAFITLDYGPDDTEEVLLLPGIGIRHFNGINVTEDGGFYFGYEVGANINLYFGGFEFVTGEMDPPVSRVTQIIVGTFFLMGKHGYWMEIGGASGGLGLGLELGLGLMAGGGFIDFEDSNGDTASFSPDAVISPLVEINGKGAMRFGENMRLTAALGVMAGMSLIEMDDSDIYSEVSAEMSPARVSLRFGFVRDY